jgi:hypothetical protein
MQRSSWLGASACFFIGVTLAGSVRAETPTRVAHAEALFQSGRQLMREGRYAEACPKLAESQSLDPAPGTQLNLADCWEHAGRTASAQREFLEVAQTAEKNGETERAAIARARAKQLENKLTKLTLSVPAQARVPGLVLLQNSTVVAEADWGKARPVDPGPFVIEARAPGRRSYRSEFSLRGDAGTHELSIPVLLASAETVSTGPATNRGQWLQGSGIGLLGLGAVGITLGTVFGVRAVKLYHRSQDEGCDAQNSCTAGALETRASAVHSGNASTVSFVIGGVLLAGGAGLYVWGSRERASAKSGLNAEIRPLAGGAYAAVGSRF